MWALMILWFGMSRLKVSVGRLFNPEYIDAPWDWAQVGEMDVSPTKDRRSNRSYYTGRCLMSASGQVGPGRSEPLDH